MKVIILAAGRGQRLSKYTSVRPKCLLEIDGITLLDRQVRQFRQFGIHDIVIVKGYAADKINIQGVRYYVNEEFAETNMVYSLFCAEPEIEGDVIISYADILFQDSVLCSLIDSALPDIAVVVDTSWLEYYQARFERPLEEAESLICSADGRIIEIGRSNPALKDIQAQYIGLIKLSDNGSKIFRQKYLAAKEKYWDKFWKRGRTFQKAYMTDFLQALIDDDVPVSSVPIRHGWLEFDTVTDYEQTLEWYATGIVDKFCALIQAN